MMLSLSLAARKKRVDPTCSRYRWGRSHGAAQAGPGPGKGKGDGHFHVCRTALNTHSLGCVSEPLRWRGGRTTDPDGRPWWRASIFVPAFKAPH